MVDVCAVPDMFVEIHVSQGGEMLFFEHQFPLGAESELRMPDSRCPVRNPQFADCLDRDRPASGNVDRSPDAGAGCIDISVGPSEDEVEICPGGGELRNLDL